MKKDWKKVGIACFAGAVTFYLLAILLAPAFKILSLFGGLAAGYVGFEFKEFIRAIPKAFLESMGSAKGALIRFGKWLHQSDPFDLYPSIIGLIASAFISPWCCYITITMDNGASLTLTKTILWCAFVVFIVTLFTTGIICLTLSSLMKFLASYGAKMEEFHIFPMYESFTQDTRDKIIANYEERGYTKGKISHRNVYHWMALAVKDISWTIFAWTFWRLWINIAMIIGWLIAFAYNFSLNMIKYVHSRERVLCALDGTLGGLLAWTHLSSVASGAVEQLFVACIGGFLGALIGIANYELLSVRYWKFYLKSNV
ncbi:hypothetical protein HQ571_02465 [Candidatus Kuenenbacteria bacterium]|nr:hypothetical protein [Candidatus Kuenenbacteria bacterium]